MQLAEVKREVEWRRCTRDPEYFLGKYWYIQHPSRGSIPFELRPAQRDGLAHWQRNRYSLTLKARQIGWSTLVGGYTFWRAFFHPDNEIILLSRTEREAIKLLDKVKYGWRRLPAWMYERGPNLVSDHQQRFPLDNESSITSMPSASDPARGSTAALVVVDEWAFLPNAAEAWASIEPVADIGGQIIGLSTANGAGNFFHELWVGAETGNNAFKAFFAPWSAVTERDEAWYAEKARTTPSWQLAQEYPNTPEEAFIKSGNPVFDLESLDAYEVRVPMVGSLVDVF